MKEQTNTAARHQAILDEAAAHLTSGDTSAYWQSMSKISRKYATLAGQVADNKTIVGRGARERLQTFAEKHKGQRFTDAEMDQIEVEIAEADLAKRRENLKNHDNAGVTVQETDKYHAEVFELRDIPAEAYTLHNAVKEMGPVADAWRDTEDPDDPDIAARIDKAAKANKGRLGERLGQTADVISDVTSAGLGGIEATKRASGELAKDVAGDKTGAAKRRAMRDNAGQFREIWDLGLPDNPNFGKPPERDLSKDSKSSSFNNPSDGSVKTNVDNDILSGAKDTAGATGHKEMVQSGSPDRTRLQEAYTKTDDPVADLLFKAPKDLTAEEVKKIQYRAADEKDRERAHQFSDHAMNSFDHRFGTDPVQYDETGRMIQPKEINPAPAKPKPAMAKGGKPLETALNEATAAVIRDGGDSPAAETTRNLQTGLNVIADAKTHHDMAKKSLPAGKQGSQTMFNPLKVDGEPGPKTRTALKTTIAQLGPAKVREGAALGRFQRAMQVGPATSDGQLRSRTERAFGPLFTSTALGSNASTLQSLGPSNMEASLRPPTSQNPASVGAAAVTKSSVEGFGLQSAINDLGPKAVGPTYKPIQEDGIIGPKTTTAFNQVLPRVGASRFTKTLGKNMGFFDTFDA